MGIVIAGGDIWDEQDEYGVGRFRFIKKNWHTYRPETITPGRR